MNTFFKKIAEWSENNTSIDSVLLVGSYAKGKARPGSDVDLVIICENPNLLLDDTSWISNFGVVTTQKRETWGLVEAVRVFYERGLEVEFNIARASWAASPVDSDTKKVVMDGARILVDKNGLLKRLLRLVREK